MRVLQSTTLTDTLQSTTLTAPLRLIIWSFFCEFFLRLRAKISLLKLSIEVVDRSCAPFLRAKMSLLKPYIEVVSRSCALFLCAKIAYWSL